MPFLTMLRSLGRTFNHIDVDLSRHIALADEEHRQSSPTVWLATIGAHLGDSLLWGAVTALLWWRAGDNAQRKQQLGGWLLSFVAALGATLGIKRAFKRRRPGGGRFLYGRGADVHSFPSGHGSRGGVILIWGSTLHPLLGRWSPLLVFWIAWARVAIGIHYLGDVVAGILVGLATGTIVRRVWQQPRD